MISIGEINSCSVGTNQIECFNYLTPEEAECLDNNTLEIEYTKGETICKQGTFASHIMVLMDGLAKIYMEGCNETVILKILPAINIIGLPILYEGNNIFQYSAQTYMPSTVRLIEINTFKEILNSNAKFAAKIVSLQSENSVITYGRFFCLTRKQTNGRLADILLCLANRIYKQDTFPLQLNRKELAELASMSLESTVRILTKFKEEGLIRVNSDSIEILDKERLNMISTKG
jgi:CRP/FNR family transcriptional regulator